jgi:outer membrane protein, multidrug efflux system
MEYPLIDAAQEHARVRARGCAVRARARLAVPAALASLLVACGVGPAYRKPDIATPTAFREAVPAAQPWPASDWWQGFGSSELDQLIQEAQRANDDLAAAIARVREADAQVRIAGAPLLPTLDAGGTAVRQRQFVPNSAPVSYTEFNPALTASYELDFWGKNRAARAAAVATASQSRFDRTTLELSIMASVANTYFSILALDERLANARANVVAAEKILQGLKTEQSVGIVNALDVAQQATEVATLSASIPPLEESRKQSFDALAILVGRAPEALALGPETLREVSHPAVTSGLASELLARRPDVASAEAQLRAANADIQEARAAFFPSIDLTASGGYASTALASLFYPGTRVFDIGASLTQPIFHGGAILGQYQYSKARYGELLSDYHKAVISAFGNVEDSLAAVRETADQLQRQQEAVDAAARAYTMSQTQFHAGTINILTVLNTEAALFTAQDVLSQVKLAHLQALVGLYQALGGGWKV